MSSQIYELFGFLVEDKGAEAVKHRKQCLCPFMNQTCDGGGNRYQSFLHLGSSKEDRNLASFFNGRTQDIPAGVCSLQTSDQKWIVCPRRLFVLDKGDARTAHEDFCETLLRRFAPTAISGKVGVWSEVKIKYSEGADENDDSDKTFDYTFDYIICPTHPKPLSEAATRLGTTEKKLESILIKNGYTLASRGGRKHVEDYPDGTPLVIEVMTSSTSGGNKAKGTTIRNAFRNAIVGKPHEAPGINYRQVWARMVSQLIVKSQIGKAWGGQTVWILQDALTNYITNTTNLNLGKLISQVLREVNILSLRYGGNPRAGVHRLEVDNLYAGQIPPVHGDTDFNRLLQAASIPPKRLLEGKLLGKRPRTFISP
jgi:hypothetical protein